MARQTAPGVLTLTPVSGTVANTTIDYGIMEGAQIVAVIPADGLGWSDIGTWEALLDVLDQDSAGNVVVGADHVSLETTDTLIHTVRGSSRKRLIATVGVSDLVIVDTDDVLLVCRRDRSQVRYSAPLPGSFATCTLMHRMSSS